MCRYGVRIIPKRCPDVAGISVRMRPKYAHIDGAVRFFTKDEWIIRKDAHVRDIGKIGKRVKIFKLEGLFSKEVFTAVLPSFFVWNRDIHQYFKDMC